MLDIPKKTLITRLLTWKDLLIYIPRCIGDNGKHYRELQGKKLTPNKKQSSQVSKEGSTSSNVDPLGNHV